MEILFFDKIDSTHKFLLNSIKNFTVKCPVCILAEQQTNGVGSRGNSWIGEKGNLFLSLCVKSKHLPDDLPIQSSSIYFAYIFKELLACRGSEIWVKWPNDFYLRNRKIGGVITTKIQENIVCSIGLNILAAPEDFGKLDIEIDKKELIEEFIKKIEKKISWKQVFSKYKIEFHKSKKFDFHYNESVVSLESAELDFDGSIFVDGKKLYNQR
ncbi:MAG: biotin--[acetyl-CoA-carboxylase] ligase [Epsilonproteobacteria bacterium]|nr:biotin--[acetyl-CoA-carboxylase] ligase [Campylobacterota bacterium]